MNLDLLEYIKDKILDKDIEDRLLVAYSNENVIYKKEYRLGLIGRIKREKMIILYEPNDNIFESILCIRIDDYENMVNYIRSNVLSFLEYNNYFEKVNKMNIFEYLSFLNFDKIYYNFKQFLETNWTELSLQMFI